jgi:tripartite-type tricarboxylate transporter receptor subunit TctC
MGQKRSPLPFRQGEKSAKLRRELSLIELPHRTQFLHLAASAADLPAVSRIVAAVDYPSKPVRILVGYAAGGATNTIARMIGQRLSDRLGQQTLIENRSGAAGNIGTEAAVHATRGRIYSSSGRRTFIA